MRCETPLSSLSESTSLTALSSSSSMIAMSDSALSGEMACLYTSEKAPA